MAWSLVGNNERIRLYRSGDSLFALNRGNFYNSELNEVWSQHSGTASLRRVDAETLQTIGTIALESMFSISLHGGLLYGCCVSGNNGVYGINLQTAEIAFANSVGFVRSPVVTGGYLYTHNLSGSTLVRRSAATGAQVSPAVTFSNGTFTSAGSGPGEACAIGSNFGALCCGRTLHVFDGGAAAAYAQYQLQDESISTVADDYRQCMYIARIGKVLTANNRWIVLIDPLDGSIQRIAAPYPGNGFTTQVAYCDKSRIIVAFQTQSSPAQSTVRVYNLRGEKLDELVVNAHLQTGTYGSVHGVRGNTVYFRFQGELLRIELDGFYCGPVETRRIVFDLARRAGVPAHRINVSNIPETREVDGFGIGRVTTTRQQLEVLQAYDFFDLADAGGVLRARRRDRAPDGTIGGDDLQAHLIEEELPSKARRARAEDYELPREVRVQYLQSEAEYEPGMQAYERRLTDGEGVVDVDLTAIAMGADKAAAIAEISMLELIVSREAVDFTLAATDANKALLPGDIKTLQVGSQTDVVRLVQNQYVPPGVQQWQALRHDPTIYATDAVGVSTRLPRNPIVSPGDTTLELLDAPLVRLADDGPGYFAAMGGNPTIAGLIEGWPGGNLYRQDPTGLIGVAELRRPGSYFGIAQSTLPSAPHTIRTYDTLQVTSSGPLVSITLSELLRGGNLAALEVRSGGNRVGWEIIQYQTAEALGDGEYELTGLLRGRFGTEWAVGLHSAGDRFVTLPVVAQVLADVATELHVERPHRAATIGRDPDDAIPVDFAWTGVDRKPYAPTFIRASRASNNDVTISWIRRDRVGIALVPGQSLPMSEPIEAYEVDVYDGAMVARTLSASTQQVLYTEAQQIADFGSLPDELTLGVVQIGELGRGYVRSITVPITLE